ncbi:PX domain containing protein [Tritrichomonas foetus]|uniref:PX domain containing protein n=1 Tax=Tritrichomonas foetus TaxID=1144522 RepID=A0A1J4KTX5_9EUKA|nr:PX domain containing protein [Tritrichomonas foetus]|eukprot:OHT14737.1 PX domain containing protein [Tritrichomonas foetus]
MSLEVPNTFNRIPLPLLTINKVALLEKSINNPPFYILIEGTQLDQNVVYYDIELCLQDDKTALLNRTKRRFSQIEKFHQLLKKSVDPKVVLPKIPPKKLFGNTSEEFINERKEALQQYFNILPSIPGIFSLDAFQVFFEVIDMDKIKGNPEKLQKVEQAKLLMGLQ